MRVEWMFACDCGTLLAVSVRGKWRIVACRVCGDRSAARFDTPVSRRIRVRQSDAVVFTRRGAVEITTNETMPGHLRPLSLPRQVQPTGP